jgi:hypothetical protein
VSGTAEALGVEASSTPYWKHGEALPIVALNCWRDFVLSTLLSGLGVFDFLEQTDEQQNQRVHGSDILIIARELSVR